ncbi:MAG TPA: S-methyl-5-thioribose-1-phosphate isomerase [Polyangia bacterium]|nr:S-methyl-5-thioribose-1-phosphate isomerase [Polyangia bacterium]
MNVRGRPMRTIWAAGDGVEIIDQTALPHELVIRPLRTLDDAAHAIRTMQVRGAPLIGAAAAYGMWLGMRADPSNAGLESAGRTLLGTRPTAVNLRWALDAVTAELRALAPAERAAAARAAADRIADADVAVNRAIGDHTLPLMREIAARRQGGARLNVLTHCNAGWLATVDRGTALAGVYAAHDAGLPIHVWVDETRPRNQGASLTAWELDQHGVPFTVIVDNAGGHLMQRGQVDVVVVGTDRTTAAGDVVNKIGTYLKALAARDCGVPFYVAAPSSSIDWTIDDGRAIEIEERSPAEVTAIAGRTAAGAVTAVTLTPAGAAAGNPAFDLTPARLVTGIITERGIAAASAEALAALFPAESARAGRA